MNVTGVKSSTIWKTSKFSLWLTFTFLTSNSLSESHLMDSLLRPPQLLEQGFLNSNLMPDDLIWRGCNNNRYTVQNTHNELEPFCNYPPPRSMEKLSSTILIPGHKKLGNFCRVQSTEEAGWIFHRLDLCHWLRKLNCMNI